jgi:valyl-tRNA synthetase
MQDKTPFGPMPDTASLEEEARDLWERTQIHRHDHNPDGPPFSVDTPPPYVSAAHLHVGHAMSYAQAEFIVRYRRMEGHRVFYPMGFDDNGLPTERFVERVAGVRKGSTTRADFRAICLEETRKGAQTYEALWRRLGLSVDWSLRYSTIDPHSCATAQRSFLELHRSGRIERRHDPVLWDTHFETALAQADLETLKRRVKLHQVHATDSESGEALPIATTRPEMLPAAVALYHHPDDARYAHLSGRQARMPGSGHLVEIRSDDEVVPEYGTGLMMVCTFGDAMDVIRWRRDGLPTRQAVGPDGRMLCGPHRGETTALARKRTLSELSAEGAYGGFTMVEQSVALCERSGVPVEFAMVPQWFVRMLDMRQELLAASARIGWNPPWMRSRLDHWIEGLKWDWNITRQRYHGVPVPAWLCACGHVELPAIEDLPIDPLEQSPSCGACPACGGVLEGDPDVLDTWMTSSMTPQINANWVGTPGRASGPYPMSVRVQGFEIIRTWLFYTVLKAELHHGGLPWKDVMISGWGLNEQGKKISKRDLEKFTDKAGFNRYEPSAVIDRYGADALRHWAARNHLGQDARYSERAVKQGRKVVVKLWNAARLVSMLPDPTGAAPPEQRADEDLWVLGALADVVPTARAAFEGFDPAPGLLAIDRFFWSIFCDDYLEIIKQRAAPDASGRAASATARTVLRTLLGLYAPFLPFVTEAIYQRMFAGLEGTASLHITRYPTPVPTAVPERFSAVALPLLRAARVWRTERRLPAMRQAEELVLHGGEPAILQAMAPTLLAVARARSWRLGPATHPVQGTALSFELLGLEG